MEGTLKQSRKNKRANARKFDIDFTEFSIELPDGSILEVDLKLLIVNEDVPESVLNKLGKAGVYYCRFGKIKADMESYLNMLEEEYDYFLKGIKAKARPKLVGNASEAKVEERALYFGDAKKDLIEYKKKKTKIRKTKKYLEQLKRTLYSFEILVDSTRSIISHSKKEWEMISSINPVVRKQGSLKTKKEA